MYILNMFLIKMSLKDSFLPKKQMYFLFLSCFSSLDEFSGRTISIFTKYLLYRQKTIDKMWPVFDLAFRKQIV